MTARTTPELIQRCRYLRTKKRMTLPEIMGATGLGRSTVHTYVKDLPLTPEELKERRRIIIADARLKIPVKEDDIPSNPHYADYVKNITTTDQKGSYAEHVVMLRAMQKGLVHCMPGIAGGKADMVILNPVTGNVYKVQVKTARKEKWGQPIANLKARSGKILKRYTKANFDIFIAYDPRHDRCYVYRFEELERYKSHVTVHVDHLERWDKFE